MERKRPRAAPTIVRLDHGHWFRKCLHCCSPLLTLPLAASNYPAKHALHLAPESPNPSQLLRLRKWQNPPGHRHLEDPLEVATPRGLIAICPRFGPFCGRLSIANVSLSPQWCIAQNWLCDIHIGGMQMLSRTHNAPILGKWLWHSSSLSLCRPSCWPKEKQFGHLAITYSIFRDTQRHSHCAPTAHLRQRWYCCYYGPLFLFFLFAFILWPTTSTFWARFSRRVAFNELGRI